jgi:hypothetical protein
MKKLILFTLAVGMIAGCSEPLVNKEIDKRGKSNGHESKWPGTIPKDAFVLEPYSFEGHKYITYINGGLVHAESCECKNRGGVK